MASKQQFEISPAQWQKFIAALDRDPQQKSNLRKLMTEKSVLERQVDKEQELSKEGTR